MRIALVGLACRHAADEVLHGAVEDALVCTYVQPEAIDGAFIQAKAVALAVTTAGPDSFDPGIAGCGTTQGLAAARG
jgi:ADP-ribosylglycohydrolase